MLVFSEIDDSKSKIDCMQVTSRDDLKYLEAKVKLYENELIKLEVYLLLKKFSIK